MNTCILCDQDVTYNEWLESDCPKGSGALLSVTRKHLLQPGQFPGTVCRECGVAGLDDDRIAAGMKCGPCAYAEDAMPDDLAADKEAASYA